MSNVEFEDDSDDNPIIYTNMGQMHNDVPYYYPQTLPNTGFLPSTLPPTFVQPQPQMPPPMQYFPQTSQNMEEVAFNAKNVEQEEAFSQYCMLECRNDDFSNYEIRNFIQDIVHADIADISTCRDRGGFPIGYIFFKFAKTLPVTDIFQLNGKRFKNSICKVTAFRNLSEFEKSMYLISEMKIKTLVTRPVNSVPIAYIFGFDGNNDDLSEILKTCVKEEKPIITNKECRTIKYHTVTYKSKDNVLKVCKTFDGYSFSENHIIAVKPLFPLAAERAFCVRGCNDKKWLVSEISKFGKISEVKERDGSFYILMESMEETKPACVFLNGYVLNDEKLTTSFIEYEYFYRYI